MIWNINSLLCVLLLGTAEFVKFTSACCRSKTGNITQQTLNRDRRTAAGKNTSKPNPESGDNLDEYNKWMYYSKQDVQKSIVEAQKTIDSGNIPKKTAKGTSGTYLLKNSQGQTAGVFKPKDEETYGPRNPRSSKRWQRRLAPCTYKRDGLLKNASYLSEVAASEVDKIFELHLVPTTCLTNISCAGFYWNCTERKKYKKCSRYPTKTGSFQTFVEGFTDASLIMKPMSRKALMKYGYPTEFMKEFQRLVILDYLIRNTGKFPFPNLFLDRHSDNWLIKCSTCCQKCNMNLLQAEHVKIAAIDHGLSFPHKAYPVNKHQFGWLRFPCSYVPFLPAIVEQYQPILESEEKQEELEKSLYAVFKNYNHFSNETFEDMMALIRGQKKNILVAFSRGYSPQQLAKMSPNYERN